MDSEFEPIRANWQAEEEEEKERHKRVVCIIDVVAYEGKLINDTEEVRELIGNPQMIMSIRPISERGVFNPRIFKWEQWEQDIENLMELLSGVEEGDLTYVVGRAPLALFALLGHKLQHLPIRFVNAIYKSVFDMRPDQPSSPDDPEVRALLDSGRLISRFVANHDEGAHHEEEEVATAVVFLSNNPAIQCDEHVRISLSEAFCYDHLVFYSIAIESHRGGPVRQLTAALMHAFVIKFEELLVAFAECDYKQLVVVLAVPDVVAFAIGRALDSSPLPPGSHFLVEYAEDRYHMAFRF